MENVINLLNSPIIGKKSPFSFVPLPVKLGINQQGGCNRNILQISATKFLIIYSLQKPQKSIYICENKPHKNMVVKIEA